ncbi:MAG: outer membrane protein assembly factor BamD [Hyphomicrobiales bacterium]|nr:outer membrane protein assembly factor BamD [Hyphomicrobiales bacterium]
MSFASRQTLHRRLAGAFAIAVALAVPGCSTLESFNIFAPPKYATKVVEVSPADVEYNQGLARMQAGDAKGAARKFKAIQDDYPGTEYARKGLLMETYAEYTGGEYDTAVQTADRYNNAYPKSADAPYIYYLAGMSYYDQVLDISRDQTSAERALQIFGLLLQKYPTSEYANDAKFKAQVMREQLAGKEMSIGRFYLARRNFTAAVNRFHGVLAKYQDTEQAKEALYRLVEGYLGLGIVSEAQTAAAVLGHNFPDSRWYKDAYGLLQGKGLSPQEDTGSWISKLYKPVVAG